jgi:RHS repeat-associated protein
VWRWDQQEPFGVNVPDENPSALGAFEFPLRFPGQYADKETNLYFNYFRDYDPAIGRYVESDPIGLLGGLNTYVYVRANPIRFNDPLGLLASDDPVSPNTCQVANKPPPRELFMPDLPCDDQGKPDRKCWCTYLSDMQTCVGLPGRRAPICAELARAKLTECLSNVWLPLPK